MDSHDVGADAVPLGSRRSQEAGHTKQMLHIDFRTPWPFVYNLERSPELGDN